MDIMPIGQLLLNDQIFGKSELEIMITMCLVTSYGRLQF
jgi:hypothetical protein